MNRMTIGSRLSLGFALIISLLVVSMGISIYRLQAMDDFTESRVPKLATGGKIVEVLLQSARQMRNVLILDHQDQVKTELSGVQKNRELARDLLARIETLVNDDTERTLFQDIAKARGTYEPLEQTFIDLAAKGDYATAKDEMLGLLRVVQVKYIGAVNAFIEYQNASSASEARQAQASQKQTRMVLLALTLIAVAVGALAAVLITRNLTKSLGGEPAYAAEVASAIAEGNLTVEVRTRAGDRTSLLASMARMREALSESVAEIRMSAEAVGSASGEIAKGNANLSRRTEEQASALGETAASMEELTSTVKQNAENARQARMLADGASTVAALGGDAVREVVSSMQGISESSRKIADIIGVIDTIAFQTNILALNAAVEAARAGEQGRGFAVVASEVRSLAQRSAQAAKEIKGLIQESSTRVDGGVKQVESAGRTMEEIVSSVKQVSGLIVEIAEASGAQLTGIEQVNRAVTQMDASTQQNAAIVEQAAAAAEHMASQAQTLVGAVSKFDVDSAARKAVEAPAVAESFGSASPFPGEASRVGRKRAEPALANGPATPAMVEGNPETGEWKEF